MILAPQYAPQVSKVQKSAVSVFFRDSTDFINTCNEWSVLLYGNFLAKSCKIFSHLQPTEYTNSPQPLATFGISTCNIWSSRTQNNFQKRPNSNLQHLAYPLATNGVHGLRKIFQKFFDNFSLKFVSENFQHFSSKNFPPKS